MQTSQEKNAPVSLHKNSSAQSNLLELQHEFNVPVKILFGAFKSADALKEWWWPKDLYADRVDLEFREGGRYFINMKGFAQGGGGMVGTFEKIIENKLIVMLDYFADEEGNRITAAEAKLPGVWPETVYITLEFEALGENKSRVKLSQEGIPNEAQADCIQGWEQSFEKLKWYLPEGQQ